MTTAPKMIRFQNDRNSNEKEKSLEEKKEDKLENLNKMNIEKIEKLLENKETQERDKNVLINNKFMLITSNKNDNNTKAINLINEEKEDDDHYNSTNYKEERQNNEKEDKIENSNFLFNTKATLPGNEINNFDDQYPQQISLNSDQSKDNLFSLIFNRNSEKNSNSNNHNMNKIADRNPDKIEENKLLTLNSVLTFKEAYQKESIQEDNNQKPNFLKTHLSSFSRLLLDHLATEIDEKKKDEIALNDIKIMERRNSENDLQKIKNEEKKIEATKSLQKDIKTEKYNFFETFDQIKNSKTKKEEKYFDLDTLSIKNYNSAHFETAINLIRQMYEKILRNEKMIPRMRKPVILKLISNIYTEKLKNYKNKQFPPFVEIVYCYFLNTYGMKKMADSKFIHVN